MIANSSWGRGFVAKDQLYLLGPLPAGFIEGCQRLSKLHKPGIGIENGFSAGGVLDTVQVRRQRQASPSHLQKMAVQYRFCVSHNFILLRNCLRRGRLNKMSLEDICQRPGNIDPIPPCHFRI